MAQLSSDLRYSKGSYAYNSSYHKQPDDPFHAPDITGWASNDIRYSRESSVVLSLYLEQLDGPFNAPEIIGGAALTDVLRLQI